MPKLTVFDLQQRVEQRQLTYVQVTSANQAIAAEEAGIDMIGTAYSRDTRNIPATAPETHFKFGLKYGQYSTQKALLAAAFQAMEDGADSVYTAQSLKYVSRLAEEGIPVFGHIGLVPPLVGWTGGFRAVGKTADQAIEMFRQAKAYENAGAIGFEIEVVPDRVASEIANRTSLISISMGSGGGCDIQYLFSSDILGETSGHVPRHARVYRNMRLEYEKLHKERVDAFKEFSQDVASGSFPARKELVEICDIEFEKFQEGVEKLT